MKLIVFCYYTQKPKIGSATRSLEQTVWRAQPANQDHSTVVKDPPLPFS